MTWLEKIEKNNPTDNFYLPKPKDVYFVDKVVKNNPIGGGFIELQERNNPYDWKHPGSFEHLIKSFLDKPKTIAYL